MPRRFSVKPSLIAAVLTACLTGGVRADPPAPSIDGLHWKLGPYITGSTAEVRELVNGPLERLLAKRADRLRQREDLRAAMAEEQRGLAATLRQTSPAFAQADAELSAARAGLEAARRAGDAVAKIDAQNRVRTDEQAVQKQLATAAATDPATAADQKSLADLQGQIASLEVPIATATRSRAQTLDGLRLSLALRGPPKDGATGLLNDITPLRIIDAHSFVGAFDAIEKLAAVKNADAPDGTQSYQGRAYHLKLLVTGTDTSKLHERVPFDLDQTFELRGTQRVGNLTYPLAAPVADPPPTDALLAVLNDLHVPAPLPRK